LHAEPPSLSHHPLRPLTKKKKKKIKGGSLYPSFPPPVLSPSSSSLERCRGAQCWGPSRLRGGHSSLRRSRFTSTRRPRSPLANQHSSIARVAPLASRRRLLGHLVSLQPRFPRPPPTWPLHRLRPRPILRARPTGQWRSRELDNSSGARGPLRPSYPDQELATRAPGATIGVSPAALSAGRGPGHQRGEPAFPGP
ncbi:unnamed protein product, partial [Ixodes persulcatus]